VPKITGNLQFEILRSRYQLAEEVPGLKHLLVLILRVVSVLSGTIRPIDTGFVVKTELAGLKNEINLYAGMYRVPRCDGIHVHSGWIPRRTKQTVGATFGFPVAKKSS